MQARRNSKNENEKQKNNRRCVVVVRFTDTGSVRRRADDAHQSLAAARSIDVERARRRHAPTCRQSICILSLSPLLMYVSNDRLQRRHQARKRSTQRAARASNASLRPPPRLVATFGTHTHLYIPTSLYLSLSLSLSLLTYDQLNVMYDRQRAHMSLDTAELEGMLQALADSDDPLSTPVRSNSNSRPRVTPSSEARKCMLLSLSLSLLFALNLHRSTM
jgi:hypothetical protein